MNTVIGREIRLFCRIWGDIQGWSKIFYLSNLLQVFLDFRAPFWFFCFWFLILEQKYFMFGIKNFSDFFKAGKIAKRGFMLISLRRKSQDISMKLIWNLSFEIFRAKSLKFQRILQKTFISNKRNLYLLKKIINLFFAAKFLLRWSTEEGKAVDEKRIFGGANFLRWFSEVLFEKVKFPKKPSDSRKKTSFETFHQNGPKLS